MQVISENAFLDVETVNGSSCDAGLQVEGCGCQEKFCNGSRMEGDTCISSTGKNQERQGGEAGGFGVTFIYLKF